MGDCGVVSRIGISAGSPYVAQVLENTMRGVPARSTAFSMLSVPPVLLS
jgi:hypothetical protein